MSTEAQIRANQQNAQHSTGPTTQAGQAASSMNNFQHGLTGSAFHFICGEDPAHFDQLLAGLRDEHQPATITESILVENMACAHWLSQRARKLQNSVLANDELTSAELQKQLSLYLRYQTTHDRAFRAALNDLLKLRSERRKAEIGFESQRRQDAIVALRQSAENRRQDRHKWDVLLAEAKVDHQIVLTSNKEWDRTAAQNNMLEAKKAA